MKRVLAVIFTVFSLLGCTAMTSTEIQKIAYEESTGFYHEAYKIEFDMEFDAGSGIDSIALSETNLENLFLLGKIWGYLKYYHPNVTLGLYNWDYELFRAMTAILGVRDREERDKVLCNWLTSLGTYPVEQKDISSSKPVYRIKADFNWLTDSGFSKNLQLKLLDIKKGIRGTGYHVGFLEGTYYPVFRNERPYLMFDYLDVGYRLLALYRFWNIYEYFYPYKYLIDRDWDDVLRDYIPRFIAAKSEKDYYYLVWELISEVHDNHCQMYQPEIVVDTHWGLNRAPVDVHFAEGKAVVRYHFHKPNTLTPLGNGDVIIKVNNETVESIIEENLKYMPGSNYPARLRDMNLYLLRTNDEKLLVKYERNGTIKEAMIDCFNIEDPVLLDLQGDFYHRELFHKEFLSYVEPDIACIYPQADINCPFAEIMAEIWDTEGLIIDMRCYPNEDIRYALTKYLCPRSKEYISFTTCDLINPGNFFWAQTQYTGAANGDCYRGKLVVIINEFTQCLAEYTVLALATVPGVTIIGSNTAGSNGYTTSFNLPGGILTAITCNGTYYPDGRETQRIGIAPDIEIKPTVQGIKEGRDELLEKAIEIIKCGD